MLIKDTAFHQSKKDAYRHKKMSIGLEVMTSQKKLSKSIVV